MDHKSVGLPDVSFHGEKAWCPDFERYSRQLGVFYSASYGEMQTAARNLISILLTTCIGSHMHLHFPICRQDISGIRSLIQLKTV